MACSVVEDGTWSGGRAECRILRLFQIFLDVFLETVIVEFVTIRISRGTPSNGVPRFRYYQLSKPFFIVLLQEGMIIVSGRYLLS